MKRLSASVLSVAATGVIALGASHAAAEQRPRLVVGIVVDQLRTDYIEQLQDYFGERGFKTLLRDGVYMRDVDFKAPVADAVSATAMIQTGAYPSQTGVPAAGIYDISSTGANLRLPLVQSATGTINNDSFSPANLRLSTLADELVIDSDGATAVYSVSMDPQQAVILAGHAGKGAYWINNSSGNWATTSYYGSLPAPVSNRNMRNSLSQRIDTMQWRKYKFSRQDRDVYKKFAASPLANREVTDVALDLLSGLNLGANPGKTDMLNVAYSLAPYRYSTENSPREELADAYKKLDAQIGRLIEAVDRRVGAENALIWLTSTGYFNDAVPVDERFRLPAGEFSAKRARSLLNTFLSAKFGSAGYVAAIRGGQVFFDKSVMESLRTEPSKVLEEARSFLVKMSGVADAYTIDEILSPSTDELRSLRLATDPRSSGDIILKFAPGTSVSYDEQMPVQTEYVRASAVMTPAFVRAPGLRAATINDKIEAVRLAPTVAGHLHIRSPNGATARPAF